MNVILKIIVIPIYLIILLKLVITSVSYIVNLLTLRIVVKFIIILFVYRPRSYIIVITSTLVSKNKIFDMFILIIRKKTLKIFLTLDNVQFKSNTFNW